MKFSAQEEYGLRCMLQFARQLRTAPGAAASGQIARSLTIGEIADIEGITSQYAGKLIRILRMGGLLESVRGRHGGYRLSRPIEQISVGEVLAVLGGRVYQPDYCTRYSGERKQCVHTVDCAIRSLWAGLQEMVDRVLLRVKLPDLLGTEKGMAEWLIPITGGSEAQFPILPHQPIGSRREDPTPERLAPEGIPEHRDGAPVPALAESKEEISGPKPRKEHR